MNREMKHALTVNDCENAENILLEIEKRLSLQYATNRQYLIRAHAMIDQQLKRITAEEALKLMEIALQLTVHSYGTERFFYDFHNHLQ